MQETMERRFGLNGFTLKWIAMISMAIDHVGMALFPEYVILRIIGRLAFPIYCFLLVEGAVYTSNKKKYLGRLFLFALISEIPFDLVRTGKLVSWDAQNVFFTLCLGLVAVFVVQSQTKQLYGIIAGLVLLFVAQYARTDYGGGGVFIILMFYVFRKEWLQKATAVALALFSFFGGLENYAMLSLIPILCYNGKRGPNMKYFFYIFYPAHLLVLYWLRFRM